MFRVFDNTNRLHVKIVERRIFEQDTNATLLLYSFIPKNDETGEQGPEHFYIAIDSVITDSAAEALLATPATQEELDYLNEFNTDRVNLRTEYQNTISQLLNIENTTSPTNAQVIAAVKYLARTLRILLRLLVKTRFMD